MVNDNQEALELDFLAEVTDKGLEKAQERLAEFLGQKVKLQPAKVLLISKQELGESLGVGDFERRGINLGFSGTYNGQAYLMFADGDVEKISKHMSGESADTEEWEHIKQDVINELGNVVLNGIVGTMSNLVSGKLDFKVPAHVKGTAEKFLQENFSEKTEVCFAGLGLFQLEQLQVDGLICFYFYFSSLDMLLTSITQMKKS